MRHREVVTSLMSDTESGKLTFNLYKRLYSGVREDNCQDLSIIWEETKKMHYFKIHEPSEESKEGEKRSIKEGNTERREKGVCSTI